MEVAPDRAKALALRWLLDAARNRNEANMADRLAAELVAAKNGEGNAVRKKNDTHKMAEANKAFALALAQNYPRGRLRLKAELFCFMRCC